MSLINDALKRATEAQAGQPTTPPATNTMQPVSVRRSTGLPIYFTPVLLFVISGAFWFIVKGWDAHRQSGLYPAPITVNARENATGSSLVPASASAPAQSRSPIAPQPGVESLIPPVRDFALKDSPSTPVAPSTPPTVAIVPALEPSVAEESKTAFKLQGIFYRPARPSAVINSKTVYVGDIISNGKVKAIDHQSVTIVVGSETKVLTLQ
jgi:hypothetical protein